MKLLTHFAITATFSVPKWQRVTMEMRDRYERASDRTI